MATESPIRMMETGGKWVSLPGAATYSPSPVNIGMDEDRLASKSQYQSARGITLNRSGSAPPSMEGSLQAWENLIQSSSAANYPSNVKIGLRLQHPVISGHIGTFGIRQRSSSSIDVTSNCLNLSRGILPTHKEEMEDDRSPKHASNDFTSRSYPVCSGPDLSSSVICDTNLVNKKQEDLHRSPSPASDQLHSLCPGSADKAVTSDADYNSLSEQSVGTPKLVATSLNMDDVTSSLETGFSAGSVSRSVTHVNTLSLGQDNPSSTGSHLENEAMTASGSEITSVESGIKALKIIPPSNLDIHKSQEEWQLIYGNNFMQHQGFQQNSNLQFQTFMPQVVSHGMNNAYVDINHIPHLGKFPSVEMQPVLQSSGFTPPHYVATTAYIPPGSPYFSAFQPPGVIYSPQYGIGGYAFNPTVSPPYLPAYSPRPPVTAGPLHFDIHSGPHYNPQAAVVPTAAGSSSNVYTQNLNKFYGQFDTLQHSFADPQMQLRSYGDFHNIPGYIDPVTLMPLRSVVGGQGNYLHSTQGPDITVASADHRPQNYRTGGSGSLSQITGGVLTPSSIGSSPNVGVFMHIPTPVLPGPVLAPSPIGGSNLIYARNEGNSSTDSGRNSRMYAGWPGQREYESLSYTKPYSFLEEIKSGKGRRLELLDIAGQVIEFSVDQHGSRFIQQKLEICSVEGKASVFREVLPHASKLMTDVFGNYVIQKFFEYGTPEQRKELANQLQGQILPLSLQMYGCRVIQKALDVIELEQKVILVHELDGHVMRCVRDQNGNHVIQKCIESIPIERIGFIISAFRCQVANLSMHPYGCRVIQRILEHCADGTQSQFIVDEILESICTLAQNQYGNYVTQHVLERGKAQERLQIIKKLAGKLVEMSQHKFASNVIEKCLEYGDAEGREILIKEIVGTDVVNDNLLIMMKDQYANYVVQKILEMCTDTQRDLLLEQIQVHLNALKKYTYGKHIVARFEQLFGEEIHASGS